LWGEKYLTGLLISQICCWITIGILYGFDIEGFATLFYLIGPINLLIIFVVIPLASFTSRRIASAIAASTGIAHGAFGWGVFIFFWQ